MKVSELSGAALDWAVATAKLDGIGWAMGPHYPIDLTPLPSSPSLPFRPSTDWAQGGPIIEREEIAIDYDPDVWNAAMYGEPCYLSGPTRRVAAMRCYVASKLGDGIEIPKELT